MPGVTALKISARVPRAMSLRLERRRDRSNNYSPLRRPRRSRSFRSPSVRVASEMSGESEDVKSGKGSSTSSTSSTSSASSSTSSNVGSKSLSENFMLPMQGHGEKVRSLIKMFGQQRQLFDHEQVRRSPIMQLQARRLRSLFALAQHLDSKSIRAESAPPAVMATKLDASEGCRLPKEPEQQGVSQLGAELSPMLLSS